MNLYLVYFKIHKKYKGIVVCEVKAIIVQDSESIYYNKHMFFYFQPY